jgi:hypothetical protein
VNRLDPKRRYLFWVVSLPLLITIAIADLLWTPDPLPYKFLQGKAVLSRGGNAQDTTRYLVIREDFQQLLKEANREFAPRNLRLNTLTGLRGTTYREAFVPTQNPLRFPPWLTDNLRVAESIVQPESISGLDSDYPVVRRPGVSVLVYSPEESLMLKSRRWLNRISPWRRTR